MVAGYKFKNYESTKNVRQFINLDDAREPTGRLSGGAMVGVHIAQDDKEWNELQKDTRLSYDVYDADLARKSNNLRGTDNTMHMDEDKWSRILDHGDIVYGESYERLDRTTGIIEQTTPEYLAYQSDIVVTPSGPEIVPNSITGMDVPLDIERHGELTSAKINENSPAAQARRAINNRYQNDERVIGESLNDQMGDRKVNTRREYNIDDDYVLNRLDENDTYQPVDLAESQGRSMFQKVKDFVNDLDAERKKERESNKRSPLTESEKDEAKSLGIQDTQEEYDKDWENIMQEERAKGFEFAEKSLPELDRINPNQHDIEVEDESGLDL